jgi:hypothetical protein
VVMGLKDPARKDRQSGPSSRDSRTDRQNESREPLWGAPRIHSELLKLGIEVGETSVGKYIIRHRRPPSQTWRTFLENHMKSTVSIDIFTSSRCRPSGLRSCIYFW